LRVTPMIALDFGPAAPGLNIGFAVGSHRIILSDAVW
jgi:hypothetical protein